MDYYCDKLDKMFFTDGDKIMLSESPLKTNQ